LGITVVLNIYVASGANKRVLLIYVTTLFHLH